MKVGDYIRTPRFLTVRIETIFETQEEAREAGYTEPTHYRDDPEWDILGWVYKLNHMKFAAVRK